MKSTNPSKVQTAGTMQGRNEKKKTGSSIIRRKPRTQISVADGSGGMVQVTDERFAPGEWPVAFDVPKESADHWTRYLLAGCEERGWSLSGLVEHQRHEDSGTKHVNRQNGQAPLIVVWERKRDEVMKVKARSSLPTDLTLDELQAFFDDVNERCASKAMSRFYRWGYLEYFGRPWLGELWLEDNLRLGPPSTQYDRSVDGPRAVIVSAKVNATCEADAAKVFNDLLTELGLFLSLIMTAVVQTANQPEQVWTWEIDAEGKTISSARQIGYIERNGPAQMPERGVVRPIPTYSLTRPAVSVRLSMEEQVTLPSDVSELWSHYKALKHEQKSKFLQGAAKWQEALTNWAKRRTLSFTLLVIACEALKPSDPKFNDHTINEVIAALLGDAVSARLKQDWFRAHDVRSQHVHLGELHGGEFQLSSMREFHDPSFDEAHRELSRIANAATIEWLRLRGDFVLSPLT